MQKRSLYTMVIGLLIAYIVTSCGPSAPQQTATAQMATGRAVDATFEAILRGTQTAEAALSALPTDSGCALPSKAEDPFNPGEWINFTRWDAWTGDLRYETPRGTWTYVQEGDSVRAINPDGSSAVYPVTEGKLQANAPRVDLPEGKIERRGPVFFYRCRGVLWFNGQYIGRVATFSSTPSSEG